MAKPILATGAAGRVGAIGRTVTELLLKQGKTVRAMVRNEDERAQALHDMGAEVVVGDLLDLDSMHRVIVVLLLHKTIRPIGNVQQKVCRRRRINQIERHTLKGGTL